MRFLLACTVILVSIGYHSAAADTLFFDDFNDGNDNGWIKPEGGDWAVDSGVYHRGMGAFPSTDKHYISYAGIAGLSNYVLETDINVLEDTPGGWGVLCFRIQDDGNFGELEYEPYTDMVYYERIANHVVVNSKGASCPFSKNTWYHFKLVIINDSVSCFVDNVFKLGFRDPAYSSGSAGLAAWHAHTHFDNFLITSVPGAPVLIGVPSPTLNRRPVLSWHSVAGVDQYVVQIDTSAGFAAPFLSLPVADTFFRPLVNLPVDTVYWRVANSTGGYYWSGTSSFIIIDSLVPVLISYVPDPTTNRRPTLRWHAVKRAGASPYTIQIDTARGFAFPLYTVPTADTFYTPATNLPLKRVYWRVKSALSPAYSLTDSLKIVNDSLPLLIAVVPDTVTNRRQVLRWHKATGALTYRLQIDTVGDFRNPWMVVPVSDTFYLPLSNLPATRICWRVCNQEYNPALYSSVDTFWVKITNAAEGVRGPAAGSLAILSCSPNPFKAATAVWLEIPPVRGVNAPVRISLAVYDARGNLVSRLVQGAVRPCRQEVVFSGRDMKGVPLSAGLYFCVLRSEGHQSVARLFLMK